MIDLYADRRCSECDTLLALQVIEAMETFASNHRGEYLAETLGRFIKMEDRDRTLGRETLGRETLDDRSVAELAIDSWLDVMSPEALVDAWRHAYGGECEEIEALKWCQAVDHEAFKAPRGFNAPSPYCHLRACHSEPHSFEQDAAVESVEVAS